MAEPSGFKVALRNVKQRDGIANFAARIGLGTDNQMSAAQYSIKPITRQRAELDAMYRSSWIVRQAVDVVAQDMTRAGVDLTGTKEETRLRNAMRRLHVLKMLSKSIKWGRLYGGAIAVMLIDGQKLETPLDPERVGRGQFRGLAVLDRWVLQPSAGVIGTFGPNWSQPEHYNVIAGSANLPAELADGRIHHTRCLRFEGDDLPLYQRAYENGWAMSVVEPFYDRLVAFDSTTMGMAQMVYRAHLRTIKIENLRAAVADGGKAFDAQVNWLEFTRRWQTLEGLTILDAKDSFETTSYNFGGLSDVLMQISQQVAGATKIPLVKLFGMSPAGFSTGETDLRSYYDNVNLWQEDDLRHPLELLLNVLHRSELGAAPSDEFGFEFAPLWGASEAEKATNAGTRGTVILAAEAAGVIDPATALAELQSVGRDTGTFATITDEDVQKARQAQLEAPPPQLGQPSSEPFQDPEADDAGEEPAADDDATGPVPGFLQRPRLVAGAGMRGL